MLLIVSCGITLPCAGQPSIAPGGSMLDRSFGNEGMARMVDVLTYDAGLQPGGKLVLVSRLSSSPDLVLMRLNRDGSVDTSFGQSGVVRPLVTSVPVVLTGHILLLPAGDMLVALSVSCGSSCSTAG